MSDLLPLRSELVPFLEPYLPKSGSDSKVHLTLTYAASLDSRISARKGMPTIISHAETKTMTHYIRSHHDAILVGVGTVNADNPGLNCRYLAEGSDGPHKIRPVILDPTFRYNPDHRKMFDMHQSGNGLPPYFLVLETAIKSFDADTKHKMSSVVGVGSKIIAMKESDLDSDGSFKWSAILEKLEAQGIRSVMVEGGANVISSLLVEPKLVSSLIVTVGPVYLGSGGVEVSPSKVTRLDDVSWWSGTQDAVVAAHPRSSS